MEQHSEIKQVTKKIETLKKTARIGLAIASIGLGSIGCDRIRILPDKDFTQQPAMQEQAKPQGDSSLVYTTTAPQEAEQSQDYLAEFKSKMKQKYGIETSFDYIIYGATDPVLTNLYKTDLEKPVPIFTKEELDAVEQGFVRIDFFPKAINNLNLFKEPPSKISRDENGNIYGLVSGTEETSRRKAGSYIILSVPEGIDLGSSPEDYIKLGLKTKKEQLQHTVIHEYGHEIANMFLRAAVTDDEYFDIAEKIWTPQGANLKEKKNPLFVAFSKLENWEIQEKYFAQNVPEDHVYKKIKPDERMVYKATNSKIDEDFAELFALYCMDSPVLTDQEKSFFKKIEEGFKNNPKGFAGEVAKNPMLLLSE